LSITPLISSAVRLAGVTRTFGAGDRAVRALDDVSLSFQTGTFTAIMGPSGSGKTTLMLCAAGLDRPDGGSVTIGSTEVTELTERRLAQLRRARVGFVFQRFNLLPSLTAAENVILPLRLAGRHPRRRVARDALARVGLGDEPTGALDMRSARDVLALLREATDREGRTVVMVTHDP
jgi:putative ABC transport system ATP-binding protein